MVKGFRLIAIRPLSDCDIRLRKVIKPSCVYKFYNNYDFYNTNNELAEIGTDDEISRIVVSNDAAENLYNTDSLNINVSALVGKNGSGKSSLIDLLFATTYSLALHTQILPRKKNEPLHGLYVEIFYAINDEILLLRANSNALRYQIFRYRKKGSTFHLTKSQSNKKIDLKDFFYTICANYSIYGLNSNHTSWIAPLFHKNDGYQTPVVINPYREEGKVDINLENTLVKQRLLCNILITMEAEQRFGPYKLTDLQAVENVTFTLNRDKIKYAYKSYNGKNITFKKLFETDNKAYLISSCYKVLCSNRSPKKGIPFISEVELYVIRKLIKIAMTYEDYKEFFIPSYPNRVAKRGAKRNRKHFINYELYLKRLKRDKSHVTFKLRQALNYLIYGTLYDGNNNIVWTKYRDEKTSVNCVDVDFDSLSKHIRAISSNTANTIYFIPPSIFTLEFNLSTNADHVSTFTGLSSGEQQQIHTVQSILYHLLNLNSVFENKTKPKKYPTYSNVNIILDEVELYFHPEFQRTFLLNLVQRLNATPLKHIDNINLLFSTHSPFILSDIPAQNILSLDKGEIVRASESETFGANFHDLLKNDFFLNNGFMGEFAKRKINELIDSLSKTKLERTRKNLEGQNDELALLKLRVVLKELELLGNSKTFTKDEIINLYSLIGEPILKRSLSDLISEVYP